LEVNKSAHTVYVIFISICYNVYMSDQVQFDEEDNSSSFRSRVILGQLKTPKMVRFLINRGIVKSEENAGTFLKTIVIFLIILTVFIFAVYVVGYNPFRRVPSSEYLIINGMI